MLLRRHDDCITGTLSLLQLQHIADAKCVVNTRSNLSKLFVIPYDVITHTHLINDSAEAALTSRCVDQASNGVGNVLRFLLWITGQRLLEIIEKSNWRLGKLTVAVITACVAWLYQSIVEGSRKTARLDNTGFDTQSGEF